MMFAVLKAGGMCAQLQTREESTPRHDIYLLLATYTIAMQDEG